MVYRASMAQLLRGLIYSYQDRGRNAYTMTESMSMRQRQSNYRASENEWEMQGWLP
jgi:hypothetical protein